MQQQTDGRHREPEPGLPADFHPRGTFAIVLVYALLFALGWAGLWLFQFMPRGVTH